MAGWSCWRWCGAWDGSEEADEGGRTRTKTASREDCRNKIRRRREEGAAQGKKREEEKRNEKCGGVCVEEEG